jgi:hypothetical protein
MIDCSIAGGAMVRRYTLPYFVTLSVWLLFFSPLVTSTMYTAPLQLAIAQTTTPTKTTNSNAFLIYENNSTLGVKIQYPSNWEKQENGTKQDTQTDVVTFHSPIVNSNANLDITIDDISDQKGMTIIQYANQNLADLKQSLTDFKLIESNTNSVVIAGLPAYKTVYTLALKHRLMLLEP